MTFNNKLFKKDFLLVAAGQIISLFGNQILRYALPLYLLTKTGSSAMFGTIAACSFIPMLLLYPIGGILADRLNKRTIMVILDFGTALLSLLFVLLAQTMNIAALMAVTMMLLYGIQGAYQPAVKASIPVLVDAQALVQANSVIDVISSLASMIGPVIGGILFSMFGLHPILLVSILCFLLSAIMELFINIPYVKQQETEGIVKSGIRDLKESFSFMMKKQPVLWKMSLFYAGVNLLMTSLVMIAVPVIITQYMNFSANTANRLYGYAQGMIAAGSVLGGLFAGGFSRKIHISSIPVFIIAAALSLILAGVGVQLKQTAMLSYGLLVLGCAMMLVLVTVFTIQIMSFIQNITPYHMIGKVVSCVICICMCTNPIGQFVYGIIFERLHSFLYLPFYAAAGSMICITLCCKTIFQEALPEDRSKQGKLMAEGTWMK